MRNCADIQKEILESSLNDLSAEIYEHCRSCGDCEAEYLKVQRLEAAFLNQALQPTKKRAGSPLGAFGLAAVCCLVMAFQPTSQLGREILSSPVESFDVAAVFDQLHHIETASLQEELQSFTVPAPELQEIQLALGGVQETIDAQSSYHLDQIPAHNDMESLGLGLSSVLDAELEEAVAAGHESLESIFEMDLEYPSIVDMWSYQES